MFIITVHRALHHDPIAWPDPERFDPNRHLNDQGEVVKHRNMMPFGAGGCGKISVPFEKNHD